MNFRGREAERVTERSLQPWEVMVRGGDEGEVGMEGRWRDYKGWGGV